ncbi:Hypothetical protein NTJ_05558 [Nesidiocoris tenuis]|uniref:Uncharacterized protein n=1 Tax=Nesidiocoris tenuis TaxID=355587 RepID=A0ABN7AMU9_9HEMI|nr:Hypothetical protein NTJ_05558 [Nesidiocoris tenuis]
MHYTIGFQCILKDRTSFRDKSSGSEADPVNPSSSFLISHVSLDFVQGLKRLSSQERRPRFQIASLVMFRVLVHDPAQGEGHFNGRFHLRTSRSFVAPRDSALTKSRP